MKDFGAPQSNEARAGVMTSLVKLLRKPHIRILEIGSYEGGSALVWSNAISQFCSSGRIICVDPWIPYHSETDLGSGEIYQRMDADLRSGTVYSRFCANTKEEAEKGTISHYRGSLAQVFGKFIGIGGRTLVDLIYIDGDHKASSVRVDIALARQILAPGGILCGDDLEKQLDEVDYDFVEKHAETHDYINGYHPGVTLAVWEAFGRVWCQSGVWAIQKNRDTTWAAPVGG